jgi:hypothetical protein
VTDDLGHAYCPVESRCIHCDCRPWGAWAKEPCGTNALSGSPMSPEEFEQGFRLYAEAMRIAGGEQ